MLDHSHGGPPGGRRAFAGELPLSDRQRGRKSHARLYARSLKRSGRRAFSRVISNVSEYRRIASDCPSSSARPCRRLTSGSGRPSTALEAGKPPSCASRPFFGNLVSPGKGCVSLGAAQDPRPAGAGDLGSEGDDPRLGESRQEPLPTLPGGRHRSSTGFPARSARRTVSSVPPVRSGATNAISVSASSTMRWLRA